jgi:hypothetical protein
MLVHKFFGRLVYLTTIWYFCGHLVYYLVIWYIFSCFGMLYKEKSGSPGAAIWRKAKN